MELNDQVTLVIFTCSGREHLLLNTLQSFQAHCNFKFDKTILAIDGNIDYRIINQIAPDLVMQQAKRGGYVSSIMNTLKLIETPYYFWLEDDWNFDLPIDINFLRSKLISNEHWVEIVLSKYGPLPADMKINPLQDNLYDSTLGFSANPCLCRTKQLQTAFNDLKNAPKGDVLGEDGFENFLTKKFNAEGKSCVILDPMEGFSISHKGYLESTPRNWHMTNSLESTTKEHLLIFPVPSFARKVLMVVKLVFTCFALAIKQFTNNKFYEYCFRVVTGFQTLNKN